MSKVASQTWRLVRNESMTLAQNHSKRSTVVTAVAASAPIACAICSPKSSRAFSAAALSRALVEP